MKIVSFAWTMQALLDGSKTATRRFWKDSYAALFHAGDLVAAWDKSPRAHGKRVATIQLTRDPYKQSLQDMTHEDFVAEGGAWRGPNGERLWFDLAEYQEMMLAQGKGNVPWVVEFADRRPRHGVFLRLEHYKALKKRARVSEKTVSALVHEIIDDWLEIQMELDVDEQMRKHERRA